MAKKLKETSRSTKYTVLVLMVVSLCTIYVLPYLRYQYFTPLQEAMGLLDNATAYGSLVSVYGIMNVIFYLPGGIIADKFDPKKLLVFSMVASGGLGLWMATWPGYTSLMIIHALWSVTTVLTFWSSSIKVVNMLSSANEQGQMFGLLEGGRGLVSLGLNAVFLAVFAAVASSAGGDVKGITFVVVCVSVLMILDGIALAFLLPKTDMSKAINSSILDSLKAMLKSFAKPITWALAGIIFTCSAIGASASYYAPYLQGIGMTVIMASTFAVIRGSVTTIIAAPIAGGISKKMGRSSMVMLVACVALVILECVLRFTPASNSVLIFLMVIMVLITFFFAANRAVYWAIIDEAGTEKFMVGSVVGIASLVGYLPDTFIHTLFGSYLDNNDPTVAFNKIFTFCIGCAVLGLVSSILAERVIRKKQANAPKLAVAAAGTAEAPALASDGPAEVFEASAEVITEEDKK